MINLNFINKTTLQPSFALQSVSNNFCANTFVCDCNCHDEGICQCADCDSEEF